MKTFLVLIVCLGLLSCKNGEQIKSETSTERTAEKVKDMSSETSTDSEKDKVYDFIVSFISKASGIDHSIKAKVDAEIAAFEKANKLTVSNEQIRWGREGEIDYCFDLKELSTTQKKEFIAKISEVVGKTDMVHLTESAKCVHKR